MPRRKKKLCESSDRPVQGVEIQKMEAQRKYNEFQQIIEASYDAIICKDLSGNITVWNDGAEAIFGYSVSEVLGRSISLIIPDDRFNEETLLLNKMLAGEKVHHFETVRRHRDGHLLDVSITVSPIRDKAGCIVGASKIARDISKQKELFAVAQKFEAIVASSDDAIISKSLDGTIRSWNAAAEKIFGYSEAEIVGQSIYRLVPPARRSEEDEILRRLAAGQKVDHLETVRQCEDGRLVEVSVTSSPIRDTDGRVIGASKIVRDITARKQSEARLRLTAQVFHSASEGILITDGNGRIVEVNRSFEHISGYARKELIGHSPLMFNSSRQGPDHHSTVLKALAGTGSYQGEVWSRRKDGQPYAGMLSINRIADAAGRPQNYVALITDITSLRVKQEELERMLHFDPLTKLANRILLSDRLQQAILLAHRNERSVAVLYLDLDQFKYINDTYGHDVGDKVLIAVSHNMKSAIRDTDTLARMGGDEFVLVLQDGEAGESFDDLINRILLACATSFRVGDATIEVSASIGFTVYPADGAEADQLIRHADQAMFMAKRDGRNRVCRFDPLREAGIQMRNEQLSCISQAIDRREFFLVYQPKVNMRLGTVIGAEALIRWNHPERGILLPADFLHFVQNDALEMRLGEYVISNALDQLRRWQEDGLSIPISVNIAASHLGTHDFPYRLDMLLAKYPDVNLTNLEFEILETNALQDLKSVAVVMHACRDLGLRFSVDDFGTGYSALTYLRHLHAETIKIDQTFVRDMLDNVDDLSIVQSVIALGHAFHRNVIAEGVESQEIGDRLLDLGCELAQGFAISRPMAAESMVSWLKCWTPFPSWINREMPF